MKNKYLLAIFAGLMIIGQPVVSQDSAVNSAKDFKYLVKDSQTPRGLNEQAVKQLRKAGFYKNLEKSLNSIHKRLKKV